VVCVIGGLGSMGMRYRAILKWLEVPHVFFDVLYLQDRFLDVFCACVEPTSFIVATPTDTHLSIYREIKDLGVPILMEKPFSKSISEVEEICNYDGFLSIVMQYQYLDSDHSGESHYNYFRHGNDGLIWDCFQIIGLARGSVKLFETSPVWECSLNGRVLSLSDMDRAYVLTVKDFLNKKSNFSRQQVLDMHKKVKGFYDENKKRVDRGAGKVNIDEIP